MDAAAQIAAKAFVEFSRWTTKRHEGFLKSIPELLEASAAAIVERGNLETALPATIYGLPEELDTNRELVEILASKAGWLVFNGFPTGVEIAHAMTHGGPYPATADGRSTSVGTRAVDRFLRPVSYQNFPDAALPEELKEANPLKIARLADGKLILP